MVDATKTSPKGAATAGVEAEGAPRGTVGPRVLVKKYANRRLYNTESSSYVTLEDLAAMVRGGRDFTVSDAKSGEDITRSVLTQIIVEEESKGRNMLPIPFLRQLIGLYGDSLQSVVPRYLEFAMGGFAKQQEQMRRSVEAMGGLAPLNPFAAPFANAPFTNLEELGKQNMAMLERAMTLFSPFPAAPTGNGQPPRDGEPGAPPTEVEALREEVETLRRELTGLRAAKQV